MSNFEDVRKFMETFGQIVRTKPKFPDEKTMRLRFDLIQEELNELKEAMDTKNLKEVAEINVKANLLLKGKDIERFKYRRCKLYNS